ncbi:helix-turn-helix domain-containing protein [Burkholderia contaminans]|uniref:helix-turn-helix domain-containing protein n=1 Tax=Burkholderia contaminans TaxID=488447 RepID=UPI00158375E1|nr:helix-turn-helix transcriptional regulator [Burkholderia contaminans]
MLGETLEPKVAFGRVLRRFRKRAGLSQEQLALEAGVRRTYVSLIELGQNQPTITIIFKLAAALNSLPSELIRETELEGSGRTHRDL